MTRDNHDYRYEAPVGQNRWDSPLLLSLKSRALDVEQVYDALFSRKAPPPNQVKGAQPLPTLRFPAYNLSYHCLDLTPLFRILFQSTQTQPLSSTNFLQELDRVTKDIVAAILAEQKAGSAVEGDEISVPGTNQKFALTHRVTLAELGWTELFSLSLFFVQNLSLLPSCDENHEG